MTDYAVMGPRGTHRSEYLTVCIQSAARALRNGRSPDLVATDLEDALAWDTDPSKCGHPRWVFKDGREHCRYCGRDVSDHDPMGG